jgi:hypothetical protein
MPHADCGVSSGRDDPLVLDAAMSALGDGLDSDREINRLKEKIEIFKSEALANYERKDRRIADLEKRIEVMSKAVRRAWNIACQHEDRKLFRPLAALLKATLSG